MNKDNVLIIVSSLSSTKLRERKTALDDLSTILKEQPELLPKNLIQSIAEALIEQVDLEYRKYARLLALDETGNKLNLSEEKLSDLSYVLRLLIEKNNNRMKLKTINFLLVALPACMLSENCLTIVKPISNHLSFATLSLINSELFKNKFNETDWIDLMEQMLKFLTIKTKFLSIDKTTINIISIIQDLLQFDTVALREVSRDLVITFTYFVQVNKVEYAHTRLLLSTINTIIIKAHLLNIKETLNLCSSCCKYILLIGESNNEATQLEIANFDYFLSELIDNKLPDMIGDEYIDDFKSITKESFSKLLSEYLLLRINYYKPSLLTSSCFQFAFFKTEKQTPFTFKACQLIEHGKSLHWMKLLSTTKLLVAYFSISIKSEDNFLLFKKQKNSGNFESILRLSDSLTSFVLSCLSDSTQIRTQLLGLQLLFVNSIINSIECKNFEFLIQKLFKLFDNDQLKEWLLLTFIPLVSQKHFELNQEITIKLFKICLPLIKYGSTSKLACSIISEIIKNSDCLVDDAKVKDEIHDIFEYPEINGPTIICNESFEFWELLYHYGSITSLSNNIPTIKSIMKWLIVKFPEIDDFNINSNQFSIFVAWLCGQNINDYLNFATFDDHNIYSLLYSLESKQFNDRFLEWTKFKESREFILQVNNSVDLDISEKTYSLIPIVQLDPSESNSFLSLLVDKIDLDNKTDIEEKTDLLFEFLMLTDKFAGSSSFIEFSTRCRDFIAVTLSNFNFEKVDLFEVLLKRISNLKIYNIKSTLPDIIPIDSFITSLKNEVKRVQLSTKEDFNINYSFDNSIEQKHNDTDKINKLIDLTIRAILKIYSTSNSSTGLGFLIKVLELCNPDTLINNFPLILSWIKLNHNYSFKNQTKELEVFTQLLGEKLLTSVLNCSNVIISYLAQYLDTIRFQWIDFIGSPLYEDCNDIFDWIISGFEASSFSGENTIGNMAVLFLNLMNFHKLSNDAMKGGKQRIFSCVVSCLSRLSPHYRLLYSTTIEQYLTSLGFKNQMIFFTEIQNMYQIPQQTIEFSSLYSLFLLKIQSASYMILIHVLNTLLDYSKYQHTRIYVIVVVKRIAHMLHFESAKDLFEHCKYDLLAYWCNRCSNTETTFEDWDEELFDFASKREFYEKYSLEFYSFKVGLGIDSKEFSKIFALTDKNDEKTLISKSIVFSIPFSYTEKGIGDLVFHIYDQHFGPLLEKYFQSYRAIIFRHILQLIDLGSITEVATAFEREQSSLKFISKLFKSENALKRYQYPFNININKGLTIIKERCIFAKTSFSDFSFLVCWILKDLSSAVFTMEKINLIRQIKLLLVLYEDYLADFSFLQNIIYYLASYLQDSDLHNEVSPVFVTLIQNFPIEDILTKANLSFIFLNLLIYQDIERQKIDTSLMKILKQIENYEISEKSFWKICYSSLNNLPISEDIYKVLNSSNFDDCDINFLTLISLVLGHAPSFNEKMFLKKKQLFGFKKILKLDVEKIYSTFNYKLWISYIARCVYFTDKDKNEIQSPFYMVIEKYKNWEMDYNSINSLFSNYIEYAKKLGFDKTSTELFLTKCLASYISSSKNTAKLLKKLSYDDLNYLKTHTTKLDKNSYEFATSFFKSNETDNSPRESSELNISIIFNPTITYEKWLVSLIEFLITFLLPEFEDIKIFLPLCHSSKSFSEHVIFDIFSAAIIQNSTGVGNAFISLTDNISTLLQTECGKQKVLIVLEILLFLRTGYRKGEARCLKIYKSITNVQHICRISLECGQALLANMLFEDLTMMQHIPVDYKFLRDVYDNINDYDLLSGLPSSRSFLEAFNSINFLFNNTRKQFLFNSAKFDSSSNIENKHDILSLANSTANNGFYSLATMIDKKYACIDNLYEWKLHLGEWNLPTANKLDTKPKGLYKAIKDVHFSGSKILNNLRSSLTSIVDNKNNFVSFNDWMSTLSEIHNYLDITYCLDNQNDKIVELFQEQNKFDNKILKKIDYNSYKLNVDSRFRFIDVIFKNGNVNSKYDETLLELMVFTQIAIGLDFVLSNNCTQDALKNSFLLENILQSASKGLKDNNLFELMKKKSSYLNAKTLWMIREENTAVNMLNDILGNTLSQESQNFEKYIPFMEHFSVSDDEVKSTLIKWLSDSKLESSSDIYEKYIANYSVSANDYETRAKVFNVMANFLNEQVKKIQNSGELEEKEKRCEVGSKDLQTLSSVYKKTNLPANEKKEIKRQYQRIQLQLDADKEILNELIKQKSQFIFKALNFYLQVLIFSNTYDNDVIDKFCNLWFEFDEHVEVNKVLQGELTTVPSWKFLPWVNQMVSKLSNDNTHFQKCLQAIIKKVVYKLPYDSIYSLMGILFYKRYPIDFDKSISQKVDVVESILNELSSVDGGSFFTSYIKPIQEFCDNCFELANVKFNSNVKEIALENHKVGHYWLQKLAKNKLPSPTSYTNITCSKDGRLPRPYITKIQDTITVTSTGISLPKIVTFYLSDGTRNKMLLKGSNDDLRQDAIMEQVFMQVNKILQNNKELRKHELSIRTYKVIPLGPKTGIIEFVANSVSLHSILTRLHKDDPVKFDQARRSLKQVQGKSKEERLRVFLNLMQKIKPQLRNFFFDSFLEPYSWFKAKNTYIKGVATTSIVGHILGLGDRHLNNILIDSFTGEPIHIDLGIAFDQGKLLPIPELVPFRLTNDIIDGFGVTGVDGIFRKNCERVYSVLRSNHDQVMCVLNILKWDPLYSWIMSPIRKHRHLIEEDTNIMTDEEMINVGKSGANNANNSNLSEDSGNTESYRALKGVEEKLLGDGLNVQATVQELVQQASDPQNLALIYMGWSPFY